MPANADDKLALGASLTPSSPPLKSASGNFTLSFRPFAASSSSSAFLYLAISFSFSLDTQPAWVANRDQPVSSSASLSLSPDGSLTLSDHSVVVWSSGTSQRDVVSAQLLDSGNLVLFNRSSAFLWQSFSYPTNTLLPDQPFGIGTNLTSQKRSDSFASGRFTLQFNYTTGVVWLSNLQYSPANYWSWGVQGATASAVQSSFLKLDQYGNFSFYQSGVVTNSSTATDYPSAATRRLTLDLDGNLRMYSWDKASSRWIRVWLAFADLCTRVKTLCGNYGICMFDPESVCICPPGFDVVDPADLSRGCRPTYPLNCNSTDYVTLETTDFWGNVLNQTAHMSEADCKSWCSSECRCLAAVSWQTGLAGHCWLKSKALNGYSLQIQDFRSFLKISSLNHLALTAFPDNATQWRSDTVWHRDISKTVLGVLAVVIAAQLVGFACLLACLIRRTNRKLRYMKLHGDLEGVSGSPKMFSYQELEDATNHFSLMLGSGGFGTVYKGQLPNGKAVAVKRLNGLSHRESQFRAEIATISRVHHINLLRLLGFSSDGEHRLLVYEYMENGSLDAILFQSSNDGVLDWKTRFQICLGVARGITYLHEECLDCILHCDIKPQNILLDKNNRPKVADFGLAYLFSREHTVRITSIRGTRGYLAPEWVSNLPITAKADVFSYGMLLFEIVSGRSNYLFTSSTMSGEENEKWCFPKWAYKRKVEEVVDERLGEEVDYEQAEVLLKVAFCCIQTDMNARPSMGKVVQMFEGTLAIPEAPLPSLFGGADYHQPSGHAAVSFQSSTPTSSSSVKGEQLSATGHAAVSFQSSTPAKGRQLSATGHAAVSLQSSPGSSSSVMGLQLSENVCSHTRS